MHKVFDKREVKSAIDRLAERVAGEFVPGRPLNVIGIRTRGETLAGRLAETLSSRGFDQIGRGVLDITLYRDDLSEIGPRPLVRPTQINLELDGRPMLLVDDVLFTGRSIRAALDALADFGRPSVIRLAVLVDRRGGRELPIQADFVGLELLDVQADQRVNVHLVENDGVDEVRVENSVASPTGTRNDPRAAQP
ncbi:MAG: bifunctional pyr operon transcriptional regulator/uracil phosphoribosyltransferase PyrR [Phycisphaerales bacterium]|nr:bifunctional pyr operon transcriptional regulator/uracil phosphoribosyltransferase PyrR [Phycisphaerales bacterium]